MTRPILAGAAAITTRLLKSARIQQLIFNAIRLDRVELHDVIRSDDLRFLSYCLARRDRSRSQIMQDLWVCFELMERAGGYFVEFGATNGLKNSNTWLLEKELNWEGILAEPNPIWHADLSANRSVHIEHNCVSSSSGNIVAFLVTNESDPELSGIANFSEADHFAETRRHADRIEVETISLDDLLDKYQAPSSIDYLSIDTEGSELEILSAYSFRHTFQTISIEQNPASEIDIERLLVAKGYHRVFKQFSQWDGWYVPKDRRLREDVLIVAPTA